MDDLHLRPGGCSARPAPAGRGALAPFGESSVSRRGNLTDSGPGPPEKAIEPPRPSRLTGGGRAPYNRRRSMPDGTSLPRSSTCSGALYHLPEFLTMRSVRRFAPVLALFLALTTGGI